VEYKLFPVEEFKAIGDVPGKFKALVAVFNNVDDGGDRIVPGAFKKALRANPRPPIIWDHQWNLPPIGQTLSAKETDEGLEVEAQLLLEDKGISGQYANSVHTGMKVGALTGFSFGFEVMDSGEVTEKGRTIRELRAVNPFEFSPTLVGMNREARLLEVASHNANTLDELADKLADRIFAKQNAINLDDEQSIPLTDAEEAAAPSPEGDERRAAQLAEINRLKHLIPR
jgi:HK97 family phage prohead protease